MGQRTNEVIRTSTMLLMMAWSVTAQAQQIYKHIDKNGNVTYSSAPVKDAKKVELPAITVVPATRAGVGSGKSGNAAAEDRETSRRNLEAKIAEEERFLAEIRNEYKNGEPDRLGSERNFQRYTDRVERLKSEIAQREQTIAGLKSGLQGLGGQ
jgi:Domain of unknown function (DUF4124)